VAAGLGALHEQDVIHRDLKPSNILFDSTGTAKVADLGLAQPANAIQVSESSFGGSRELHTSPGTPAYMSPEQESGKPHLPPASDVYSLGLILFEMLTGRSYKNQPPGKRVRTMRSDVPATVDELLVKMLSEDPRRRPWNGAAAEKALSKLLKTVSARTSSSHKFAKALLIVGAVALLVGLGPSAAQTLNWLPGHRPTAVTGLDRTTASPQTSVTASDPNTPPACTQINQAWISPIDGMTLVCVPAGEFLMGSTNEDADDDEKPQHTVYLDAYWIDQTEVTNAMFAEFVAAKGYRATGEEEGSGVVYTGSEWTWVDGANWQHPSGPGSDLTGKEDHPVVQVNWDDAAAYCAWAGRQLPSEAQWEKAARGEDGRLYPWGNADPTGNRLNFADINTNFDWSDKAIDDGYEDTAPVGSFPAGVSPYGMLDMAGNVWEWTAEWYGINYYSSQTTWRNPVGPVSGDYRMVRGGSWYSNTWYVRTAGRLWRTPDLRDNNLGFRCSFSTAPLIGP